MAFHCLLASAGPKLVTIFIYYAFSLNAFQIFSLPWFSAVWLLIDSVILCEFIPLGFIELLICKIMFFTKLDKFLAIISSKFFLPRSLALFLLGLQLHMYVRLFIFCLSSLRSVLFPLNFFSFLLFRLNTFINISSNLLTSFCDLNLLLTQSNELSILYIIIFSCRTFHFVLFLYSFFAEISCLLVHCKHIFLYIFEYNYYSCFRSLSTSSSICAILTQVPLISFSLEYG